MATECEVDIIPSCCGAILLKHFYNNYPKTNDSRGFGWYTPEQLDRYNNSNNLLETKQGWHSRIRAFVEGSIKSWTGKKSWLIAILNRDEKELEYIFLEAGFTILIPETRNPTGTSITMYMYHLLPDEIKPVKSILKKKAS